MSLPRRIHVRLCQQGSNAHSRAETPHAHHGTTAIPHQTNTGSRVNAVGWDASHDASSVKAQEAASVCPAQQRVFAECSDMDGREVLRAADSANPCMATTVRMATESTCRHGEIYSHGQSHQPVGALHVGRVMRSRETLTQTLARDLELIFKLLTSQHCQQVQKRLD